MDQNQDPSVTVSLQLSEINVILAALQEIPAKLCNPITNKIVQQANEQLNPPATEEAKVDSTSTAN